jgi:hypothetical protein
MPHPDFTLDPVVLLNSVILKAEFVLNRGERYIGDWTTVTVTITAT